MTKQHFHRRMNPLFRQARIYTQAHNTGWSIIPYAGAFARDKVATSDAKTLTVFLVDHTVSDYTFTTSSNHADAAKN